MVQSSKQILYHLLREIRSTSYSGKVTDSLIAKYIINQYRKYNVTSAQLCKREDEMNYLADTYRCYLRSARVYKELYAKYHGKGQRSIQETADIVGFKLPHDRK